MKNWQLLGGPSATVQTIWGDPGDPTVPISYTYNSLLAANGDAVIEHPSACIMVWEGLGTTAWNS